jgi:hypothetical protein
VVGGVTAVVSGALAAFARKRAGRHPIAGQVYVTAVAAVFATATVMAALRWRQDRHLFVVACVAATWTTGRNYRCGTGYRSGVTGSSRRRSGSR